MWRCMEADLGVCGASGAGVLEVSSTKAAKSFALPHHPFSTVETVSSATIVEH